MSQQFGESTVTSAFGAGAQLGSAARSTRTTPKLFGPEAVSSRARFNALNRVTPGLVERGLRGVDPRERRRLKTSAFESIGQSTKSSLSNLRELFGRAGVRGGVQGADVADIIESAIGAQGAASTGIEGQLRGDANQQLQALLAFLSTPEPFALGAESRSENPTAKNLAEALSRGEPFAGGIKKVTDFGKSVFGL